MITRSVTRSGLKVGNAPSSTSQNLGLSANRHHPLTAGFLCYRHMKSHEFHVKERRRRIAGICNQGQCRFVGDRPRIWSPKRRSSLQTGVSKSIDKPVLVCGLEIKITVLCDIGQRDLGIYLEDLLDLSTGFFHLPCQAANCCQANMATYKIGPEFDRFL